MILLFNHLEGSTYAESLLLVFHSILTLTVDYLVPSPYTTSVEEKKGAHYDK